MFYHRLNREVISSLNLIQNQVYTTVHRKKQNTKFTKFEIFFFESHVQLYEFSYIG